jgi:hypothetical protein
MDAAPGTRQAPRLSETSVAPDEWPLHGLGERAKRDRATVLVVDDDRDVRDILGHYFTAKGYDVETLESRTESSARWSGLVRTSSSST